MVLRFRVVSVRFSVVQPMPLDSADEQRHGRALQTVTVRATPTPGLLQVSATLRAGAREFRRSKHREIGSQTAPMLEDVASASVHPISWFTDGAHVGGCGVRFGDSNQTGKMKSCDAYLSQLGSVCIVK